MAENESMWNPISAVTGGVGGIIGGLISYYGIKEQTREAGRTRQAQTQMFEEQRADESKQLGEKTREFNVGAQQTQQQMGQQYQISNKQLGLQSKSLNAQISESQATRAQALQQKKLEDNLAMFNHITNFLNTPGARAQFASLWGGK